MVEDEGTDVETNKKLYKDNKTKYFHVIASIRKSKNYIGEFTVGDIPMQGKDTIERRWVVAI